MNKLSMMAIAIAAGMVLVPTTLAYAAGGSVEGIVKPIAVADEATITQSFANVVGEARAALASSLTQIGDGLAEAQIDIANCERTRAQRSPETMPAEALSTYHACLSAEALAAANLNLQQADALQQFADALSQAKTLVEADQQRLATQQKAVAGWLDEANREVEDVRAVLKELQTRFGKVDGKLSFEQSQTLVRVLDDQQRAVRKAQRRNDEIAFLKNKANQLDTAIDAFNDVAVLLATARHVATNEADEFADIAESIGRGPLSFASTTSLELGEVVTILNGLTATTVMPELYPSDDGATTATSPAIALRVTELSAAEALALIADALGSDGQTE